jgi:hypothetical protein
MKVSRATFLANHVPSLVSLREDSQFRRKF